MKLLKFTLKNKTNPAKIKSKPTVPVFNTSIGISNLNLEGSRNSILYVPNSYNSKKPTPLFLIFHGAGGDASIGKYFHQASEKYGFIVLAIESIEKTWDMIYSWSSLKGWGNYNKDVQFLDKALKYTFEHCYINSNKITLAGFSDGASYALSLGLINGTLFSSVIAYSPGFIKQSNDFTGKPKIYIAHGKNDNTLSIELSRKYIFPYLQNKNYNVTLVEHEEGHWITEKTIEKSFNWLFLYDN